MSHYINLSDKPVKPITKSDINNKNKQNQTGFLSGLLKKKTICKTNYSKQFNFKK